MCVPDLTCLASTVSKILKGIRNFICKSRDSGHAPLGTRFSFLVSTDLVKFEACSFSHSEDTAKSPEMYNLKKM